MSQSGRFERFVAQMVYILAGGRHIDMDATPGFSAQLDEVYANPFEKKQPMPQTAEEITSYVLNLVERRLTDGSDDAGRKADAG